MHYIYHMHVYTCIGCCCPRPSQSYIILLVGRMVLSPDLHACIYTYAVSYISFVHISITCNMKYWGVYAPASSAATIKFILVCAVSIIYTWPASVAVVPGHALIIPIAVYYSGWPRWSCPLADLRMSLLHIVALLYFLCASVATYILALMYFCTYQHKLCRHANIQI